MNSKENVDIKSTLFYKIADFTGGVDKKAGIARVNFCKVFFLVCLVVTSSAFTLWFVQYLITLIAALCGLVNAIVFYPFMDFIRETIIWDILASTGGAFDGDEINGISFVWFNIPITAVLLSILYFVGKFICKKLSFEKSFISTSDDTEVAEVAEKEEDLLVGSYSQYALKNIATGELLRKSPNSNEVVTWSDLFAAKEFYDKKIMTKKHFKIVGFD